MKMKKEANMKKLSFQLFPFSFMKRRTTYNYDDNNITFIITQSYYINLLRENQTDG